MVGLLKRTHEEMEASSREGVLENPGSVDHETPRKKPMLDAPNGNSIAARRSISDGSLPTVNGTYANGLPRDQSTAAATSHVLHEIANELAPEIPHITQGYISLELLTDRLSQEIFEGLNDLVDELVRDSQVQANGFGAAAAAESNTRRRTKLWEFAAEKRAKLIKLLVLSQWTRNVDAIGKAIDIVSFLSEQRHLYGHALNWIAQLPVVLRDKKLPASDILQTVETLLAASNLKVEGSRYIPPEPLSPMEMLEGMQQMNAFLAVRLQLHETIPDPFHNYVIKDGRVTFTVQDEFELALSIFSSDPNDQLFFVDLKLAFSPGGGRLPEGLVLTQVESRINGLLRERNLSKCYDFLHSFVLTHKLSVLRIQAAELVRSRWGDDIRIEAVHRALVVQYWTNRPGGKNWIEIGIKRRKSKHEELQSGFHGAPYLAVRWHRHGREIIDHEIDIDHAELSLEAILKETIAAHTNYILEAAKADLTRKETDRYSDLYEVKQLASPVEPADCSIHITLPEGKQIILNQEPISGRLALLPPSKLHTYIESDLNRLLDPASGIATRVKHLRAYVASDRARDLLSLFEWRQVQISSLHKQTVESSFGRQLFRFNLYRPPKWSDSWCLALCQYTYGVDKWWMVKLQSSFSQKDRPSKPDFSATPEKSFFSAVYEVCAVPTRRDEDDFEDQVQLPDPDDDNYVQDSPPWPGPRQMPAAWSKFARWLGAQSAAGTSRVADGAYLSGRDCPEQVTSREYQRSSQEVAVIAKQTIRNGTIEKFDPVAVPILHLNFARSKSSYLFGEKGCYHDVVSLRSRGIRRSDSHVVSSAFATLEHALPVVPNVLRLTNGRVVVHKPHNRELEFVFSSEHGKPAVPIFGEHIREFALAARYVNYLQKEGLDVRHFDMRQIRIDLSHLVADLAGSRNKPWTGEQLEVSFLIGEKGSVRVKFGDTSPLRGLSHYYNGLLDRFDQSNGSSDCFQSAVVLIKSTLPFVVAISEQAMIPGIGPYLSQRATNQFVVDWSSFDDSCSVRYSASWNIVRGEPAWRVDLEVKTDGQPPGAVEKIKEQWDELCMTNGEGFEGYGKALKVDPLKASTVVWLLFDRFEPHLKDWLLHKNEAKDKTTAEIKPEVSAEAKSEKQASKNVIVVD